VCDAYPLDAANDADGDGVSEDADACADTAVPELVPDHVWVGGVALALAA
jgi:hypothetical protein